MYNSFEKLILILFDKYDKKDHLLLSVDELNYLNFIRDSLKKGSEDVIRKALNTFSSNSNIEDKKVKVLMITLIKLFVAKDFDYPYPVISSNKKEFITETFIERIGHHTFNQINESLNYISTVLNENQKNLLKQIDEGNYEILEEYKETLNFNIGLLTPINIVIQKNNLDDLDRFISAINKNSNQKIADIINYIPPSDSYQELYLSSVGFSVFTKKSIDVIDKLLENGGDFRNVWNGSKFVREMNNDILSLTIIILYNKLQTVKNIPQNKSIYKNSNQNYVKMLITKYLPRYTEKSNLNLLGYKGIKGFKIFSKKKLTPHNVLQKLKEQSKNLIKDYNLTQKKYIELSDNNKRLPFKKMYKNVANFLNNTGKPFINKFNENIKNINKQIENQKGKTKKKLGMRTTYKNTEEITPLLTGGSISGILFSIISILGITGFFTICGASTGGTCFIVALILLLCGISGLIYTTSTAKNKIIKNIEKYLKKIEGTKNLSILFRYNYDFIKRKNIGNIEKIASHYYGKEQLHLGKLLHLVDSDFNYYSRITEYLNNIKNSNSNAIKTSYDLFNTTFYEKDKEMFLIDKKLSVKSSDNSNSNKQSRDYLMLINLYLILRDYPKFSFHYYFLVGQNMYYSNRFLNYIYKLYNEMTAFIKNSNSTKPKFIDFVKQLKKNIKNNNGNMKKEYKFYIAESNQKQINESKENYKNQKYKNLDLQTIDHKYPDLSYIKINLDNKVTYSLTGYLIRLEKIYNLCLEKKLDFIKFAFCILNVSLVNDHINDILNNLQYPKDYNVNDLKPFIIAPIFLNKEDRNEPNNNYENQYSYKFYDSIDNALENNIILMVKHDFSYIMKEKTKIETPTENISVKVYNISENVTRDNYELTKYNRLQKQFNFIPEAIFNNNSLNLKKITKEEFKKLYQKNENNKKKIFESLSEVDFKIFKIKLQKIMKTNVSSTNEYLETMKKKPKRPINNINKVIKKRKESDIYKKYENQQERLRQEAASEENERQKMEKQNKNVKPKIYKTLKNAHNAITRSNSTNSTESLPFYNARGPNNINPNNP